MRPKVAMMAFVSIGILVAALLLSVIGSILGRGGSAWLLPLVALPVIAELVILWQKNMEWLGKFLLTTDGILCSSPLSAPLLLRWDEIADCCYVSGKERGSGTYCLSSEKLNWEKPDSLPTAPGGAKFVKIAERGGLAEVLTQRLPKELSKKLSADRGID